MLQNRVTNSSDPIDDQDLVTKKYYYDNMGGSGSTDQLVSGVWKY